MVYVTYEVFTIDILYIAVQIMVYVTYEAFNLDILYTIVQLIYL